MSRIAEAQLHREARRIFRRLVLSPGAYIAAEDADFSLFVSDVARKRAFAIEADVMRALLARGWLTARDRPERWRLSAAGEGWYLRETAASEPFANQHRVLGRRLIETEAGKEKVTVNERESPLGWLKRRGLIDESQFAAGEKLRRDFTLAQLSPRLGVDLSQPIAGRRGMAGAAPLTDTVLAAKQRFRAAMVAAGPGLADVAFDICCHLSGLEAVEATRDWPRRSAKVVLDIALDRLARHYGLRITAPARAKMRAWQAEEEEP